MSRDADLSVPRSAESGDPADALAAEVRALADHVTAKLAKPLWLPSRSEIAAVRDMLLRVATRLQASDRD